MIYLDTSVALAHLLAEDRHPPDNLWTEVLVSCPSPTGHPGAGRD